MTDLDPLNDADLERLSQLCEASATIAHPAIRPERRGQSAEEKRDSTTDDPWGRAIQRLLQSISGDNRTLGSFLDTFMYQGEEPIDYRWGQYRFDTYLSPILQSVAAVLYELESGGQLEPLTGGTEFDSFAFDLGSLQAEFVIPSLFEHMLLVDYGLGIHPLGGSFWCPKWVMGRFVMRHIKELARHLCWMVDQCIDQGVMPDKEILEFMGNRFWGFQYTFNMADVAIMLFYYHTHHDEISQQGFNRGLTGYTGVMNELIAEIPTRGSARLTRKLSVDFYELIPKCVRSTALKETLRAAVVELAIEHRIRITVPGDSKSLPTGATA